MKRLTDEQRDMVGANIGLAYAVADAMRKSTLHIEDRGQAGITGLMRAVGNHDPDKAPLSLHAKKYIKQAIVEAEAKDRTIYVPARVFQKKRAEGSGRRKKDLEAAIESKRVNAISDVDYDKASVESDPARLVEHADWLESLKVDVRDSMSNLKPKQKTAISGFLDGEEQSVAAGKLGCTEQNISALKKSAYVKMRKRLAKYADAEP